MLAARLRRAREATYLLREHARGAGSWAALVACYASVLRSTTEKAEVSLRLRLNGAIYPFRMRKSDIFTLAEILHERQYELHVTLPPAPVIVDAGANIGVSALWLAAGHPGARMHAFEPEPDNFRLLSANLRGLPGMVLNQAAVGDSETPVVLRLAAHGAEHSVVEGASGEGTVSVPSVRLDHYFERQGIDRVDLLKLDVEGHELRALQGLGDRIDAVQAVIGECHERLVDAGAFYAFLESRGFRVLRRTHFGAGEADGTHVFEATR